jgi:hypothetical protein
MRSAPCPVLGNGTIDTRSDRRGVFYVVRAETARQHASTTIEAVFSLLRGPCRDYIRDSLMEGQPRNIRGLNLAAVKHTTVQVSRLPL